MIKFGVIGCGSISGTHAAAIDSIKQAELVACCDSDVEKGQRFALKHNCRYYQDYHALLASDVDVVTIATPHYLHKEMSIAALKANKHVICEKPMAITEEEAEEIILAEKESNHFYAVCFQNRFNPSFLTLKSMINKQIFGKLKGMKCEITWKRDAEYYTAANWKGSVAKEGGGVLINQAIHTLDAISWLFSQPYRVKGKVMTALLEGVIEVEDAAMATAQLKDGTPIIIFASNNYSSDPMPMMTFDFEQATVELTMEELRINGEIAQISQVIEAENKKNIWGNGHQRLFQVFVNQLLGMTDSLIPNLACEDAKNAIALLRGIYRSDTSNHWELI